MTIYDNIITAYLGDASQNYHTQILNDFGLTVGGKTATEVLADPTLAKAFANYVEGIYLAVPTTAQMSPEERAKREILFLLFNLSLSMMKTLQTTISTTANVLAFNSKYQAAYTSKIASVSFLTEAAPQHWTMPEGGISDAANITFGFNNIKGQDIADYMAKLPSGKVSVPLLTTDGTLNPLITMGFIPQTGDNVGGTVKIYFSLVFDKNAYGSSVYVKVDEGLFDGNGNLIFITQPGESPRPVQRTSYINVGSVSNGANASAWVSGLRSSLTSLTTTTTTLDDFFLHTVSGRLDSKGVLTLNAVTKFDHNETHLSYSVDTRGSFAYPWPSITPPSATGDAKKNLDQANQQKRSDTNLQLQQYISSLQAAQQSVRDAATGIQSNVSQATQSYNAQMTFFESVLQNLKTMLSGIFR